jgi:DNA-binding transcriptional LysR family regulator
MSSARLEGRIARKFRLQHLQMVAEIYDCRGILKASQRLNLTQPAVTKALQDIEQTLDLTLFERTSRGLHPTVYGEVFARHAKLVLAQLRHAAEELENLHHGYGGHVSVGTLLAASVGLLPKAIVRLKEHRPEVAITVIDGTYDLLLPSLRVGDLDIVLGRLPERPQSDGLVYEELYLEPSCLVVRPDHPLAAKSPTQLQDLLDEAWLLPLPETSLRRQIERAFTDARLPLPSNIIESMSILTNRALLRETDLIAVIPYHVAKEDVDHGLLHILPVRLTTATSPVGVITRTPGDLPPAAKIFLEHLRNIGREISSE